MDSQDSSPWEISSAERSSQPGTPEEVDSLEPIAIVGMGLRLPGNIHTEQQLWELITEKRSTRGEIPKSRFNVDGFYSPTGRAGSIAMKHGHFLTETDNFRHLDTSFFSMGRKEVDDIDPQQRMLLEVVYECMQSSGQVGWRGSKIGCYVGVWGEDWLDLHAKDTQDAGMYRIPGGHDFAISNRISYEYDLRGPSFTIKAGCSSSLIALHDAVRAIRAGDCSGALVAGTNLIFSPTMSIAMTEQGVLSPDGSCKTFDAAANGYARGEAINAIYVKSLSDAIKDNDKIRAVIRATATNCDGKTPGMSMPSSEGHEALIRRAYREASLDPTETVFVEAHGTGTPVGDPLEATAIARVFGGNNDPVYIGSVKPNLGHSEGASGVSSVIKAVLALENMTIPPNINFSTPNPKIPFQEANMEVPIDPMTWPSGKPLRVSVNSFGIGGANAHAILESAAPISLQATVAAAASSEYVAGALNDRYTNGHTNDHTTHPKDTDEPCRLVRPPSSRRFIHVFSAAHPASLKESLVEHERYIRENPSLMTDISYTLCNRREHLANRAYCVTSSSDGPLTFSPVTKTKRTSPITMVFTGQGAQWAGMAKELMDDYPSFDKDIIYLGAVLAKLEHAPSWDLRDELRKPEEDSNLPKAEYSQPLVAAVQVALVNLLRQWGIRPNAVVGHSSGEIAAAYAAKAITAEEAITIAYYRGYMTKGYQRLGGMAAIGLGREQVTRYLRQGTLIACENSPHSVTLSGDLEALEKTCEIIRTEEPGCLVRRLKVEMAYHSHHMLDIGDSLEALLRDRIDSKAPVVPFFSSVRATRINGAGGLNASYWRENLESPVLFYGAISHLVESEACSEHTFLEVGPHGALRGPLRQILQAANRSNDSYITAMIRGKDCTESILHMAGELYLNNTPVDFGHICPSGCLLTNLPSYKWQHVHEYWAESRLSKNWRFREFPHHELLGSRILEGNDLQPEWRNVLRLEDVPWLRDHQVINDIIFPCAGYLGMAGEAIRQISSAHEFTFRDVVVHTALVLTESKAIEMITSLRPVRLTTTLDSVWWEFSIFSYNETAWVKHCVGQIRTGATHSSSPLPCPSHPRSTENLYPILTKVGLNYGPCFRGLSHVSCLPNKNTASARLLPTAVSESTYAVHPTTIDHCLQLLFPASCDGIYRRVTRLCVPTKIEQLYLCGGRSDNDAVAEAVATISSAGVLSGRVVAKSDKGVFLSLVGGKFSPLEVDTADDLDPIGAAKLHWKPDLDLADMRTLIKASDSSHIDSLELELVEKMALLSLIEVNVQTSHLVCDIEHLEKYRSWMHRQTSRASSNSYDLVPNAKDLLSLDSDTRLALIFKLKQLLSHTDAASAAELISRIVDNCSAIMQGKVEGIEVLQARDGLTNYYNFVESRTDSVDFFAVAGHTKPTLRVLEIGAGTGGGTAVVLRGLTTSSTPRRERMYSKYAFTDISAGFFVPAQERFKEYEGIEYKVLDITKDPIEQGFQAESYDLIIAGNVLHATPSINATLANVRKLLAPEGYLFLQELSPQLQMVNLIMGILPGWWLGETDGRVNEPFLTPEEWNKALKMAGFSGVEAAIYDGPRPYHINANIISRPVRESILGPRRVTLLHSVGNVPTTNVDRLQKSLIDNGYQVDLRTLQEGAPADQDIVSVLELESPLFESVSHEVLLAFQDLIASRGDSKILWVTRPAQKDVSSTPGFGLTLGLARTLRSEQFLSFMTLEVDRVDDQVYPAIVRVLGKIQSHDSTASVDADSEFILRNGVVHVGRYQPASVAQDLELMASKPGAVRLAIGRPGLLQSLQWIPFPTTEPRHGEVVVEPRCAGLNFRDVLLAMGIVEANNLGIGLEGSGVITDVGAGVTDLQVGDRVFYLDDNCFSTRITMSAMRCAKIPSFLSYEEAATMPCVYATVIHSLVDIGGLQSGQSVLIHSACGGIGIAAINVCQSIGGVQVYVTVGNQDKVRYLMETFNIPRASIFNSRDTSFREDVLAHTNGRGVDLVLNSLSGELLHASWECVAPYGKMLEIGKRDFIGKAKLSMDIFEANRSFIGIDLARFDAARCHPLLTRTVQMLEAGHIKPIAPRTTFSAGHIEDSFRYMQKGTHMGKIVVTFPEGGRELPIAPIIPDLTMKANASYLLVGGMGGLGRAVATWLVEKGARHLVFFSRSAGNSEQDRRFIQELESQGCSVRAIQGSVLNEKDVARITQATEKPIKGVFQMSMVLRDKPFMEMDLQDWTTAVGPKVQGTWNLHHAMPSDLDFFFATGSISGSFGTPGQANYAAGNTFLNAFTQYRRSLGLPTSILHIGLMDDVGYLTQNVGKAEALRAAGGYFLREKDLLDSLQWAIVKATISSATADSDEAQLTIGLRCDKRLSDPTNRVIWRKDARMGLYHNRDTESSSSSNGSNGSQADALKAFMASVEADPEVVLKEPASLEVVTREMAVKIYTFMLHPLDDLDVNVSLTALGVDSLVTIEIRNWMKRSLGGIEISTLEILNAGSIASLGRLVIEALKKKFISQITVAEGDAYLEMKAP
ncbi:polyketide synthase [Aspergillus niger]|uniref:type I polyketide synthase n=1 Tax=Aspergillus lacticoffeatus (strain CBS 101883) TaxID=1450533 RepID=UPI000D7FD17A|nr:uncharacterized protein BO96DRAFT_499196 [Aspergillus niger CBS 101883]PYH58042.1 hypothetical protein BO96DRAFT_499196 [Aspergillus niger CBS 101883]GJP94927.1 polyketide synthase [Aspergillus niger]